MTTKRIWAALFVINLVSVGLRVFQQLNVMGSEYLALIPVSYGMAAMLVLTTLSVVGLGFDFKKQAVGILCIGTGGWIGSWVAIYVHSMVF